MWPNDCVSHPVSDREKVPMDEDEKWRKKGGYAESQASWQKCDIYES